VALAAPLRTYLAATAAVAIAYAAVLIGAMRSRIWFPWVSDTCFGTLAAFAIAGMAAACFRLVRGRSTGPDLKTQSRAGRAQFEEREAYLEVSRAYRADSSATRTCPHLAPVERAIRADRIAVDIAGVSTGSDIIAWCVVDGSLFSLRFPSCDVRYAEYLVPDRDGFDIWRAGISCSRCSSRIATFPLDAGSAKLPVFPGS
jgi:hypothetical protein